MNFKKKMKKIKINYRKYDKMINQKVINEFDESDYNTYNKEDYCFIWYDSWDMSFYINHSKK